jgi:hypothetical protein
MRRASVGSLTCDEIWNLKKDDSRGSTPVHLYDGWCATRKVQGHLVLENHIPSMQRHGQPSNGGGSIRLEWEYKVRRFGAVGTIFDKDFFLRLGQT